MSSTPKHNLVALSSAAIIAVYSAGYLRTKAAAAKIADHDERRPPVRATTPRPRQDAPIRREGEHQARAGGGRRVVHGSTAADAVAKAARDTTVTVAPTVSATVPVEDVPVPAAVPAASSQASIPAPAADTSKRADSAKAVWKDGYYFGWGTSRHGDIQAGVEIKDGKIVSALITQCLTRYSCSWIDHLQGQVVARQSPEVDFVSGATQSTNAFYYAVVEALSKAR